MNGRQKEDKLGLWIKVGLIIIRRMLTLINKKEDGDQGTTKTTYPSEPVEGILKSFYE